MQNKINSLRAATRRDDAPLTPKICASAFIIGLIWLFFTQENPLDIAGSFLYIGAGAGAYAGYLIGKEHNAR